MRFLGSLMLAVAISCTSQFAVAQISSGQLSDAQTFGNWSAARVENDTDIRFRVASTSGAWTFIVDQSAPDCVVTATLSIYFPGNPVTQNTPVQSYPAFLRVDTGELFSGSVFGNMTMGDEYIQLTLAKMEGFSRLARAMRDGQTLRISLTVNGQQYTPAFQLNGFSSAVDREMGACAAFQTTLAKPRSSTKPKRIAPQTGSTSPPPRTQSF
jgi:hypothetical protein